MTITALSFSLSFFQLNGIETIIDVFKINDNKNSSWMLWIDTCHFFLVQVDSFKTHRKKILLDKNIAQCRGDSKPDIVHIITPIPPALATGLSELKKLGCKLVYSYTIVDDFPENVFLRFMHIKKVWRALKYYDVIIVPSSTLKAVILNLVLLL